MEPSDDHHQNTISSMGTPVFSPFLVNSLETQGRMGFRYGSACYNQKHNMIIAYPREAAIQFYDATTLMPVEGRNFIQLTENVSASCMSYHQEPDTYIIGFVSGVIYTYNASSQKLRKLLNSRGAAVQAIAFVNSKHYSFACSNSKELSIGNLENDHVLKFGSGHNSYSFHLSHLNKSHILLSALEDGYVIVYCTKNLPKLRMICSVPVCRYLGAVHIQGAIINGKEYVITAKGYIVKIWQMRRGKMRLLKVIQMKEPMFDLVYLENEKMIAVVDQFRHLYFFRLLSGKLETTLDFKFEVRKMFLMKEKNMIGLVAFHANRIDIVQLHRNKELL